MGKKKLRKKNTSKGVHSSVSGALATATRNAQPQGTKLINIIRAWKRGENPWITIENPTKQTNMKFIKVRTNEYFGDFKAAYTMTKQKADTNDSNQLI